MGRYPSLGMQGGGGVVVANWGLGGSAPLLVRFLGASEKMNEHGTLGASPKKHNLLLLSEKKVKIKNTSQHPDGRREVLSHYSLRTFSTPLESLQ